MNCGVPGGVIVKDILFDENYRASLLFLLENSKCITFINCSIEIPDYPFLKVHTRANSIKFIDCDFKTTSIKFSNDSHRYALHTKEISFINTDSKRKIYLDLSIESLNIISSRIPRISVSANNIEFSSFRASILNSSIDFIPIFAHEAKIITYGTFDFSCSKIGTITLPDNSKFFGLSKDSPTFRSLFNNKVEHTFIKGGFWNCSFNGVDLSGVNFTANEVEFYSCNFDGSDFSNAIITGRSGYRNVIHFYDCSGIEKAKLDGRIYVHPKVNMFVDRGPSKEESEGVYVWDAL